MSGRVLMVVEDRDVAALARALLVAEQHQVTPAPTGAQALEISRRVEMDLVVAEFDLVGAQDGALLARLRAEAPDTPIILLVSPARMGEASETLRDGVWDLVPRPLQPWDLPRSVARALEHQRLRDAATLLQASAELVAQRDATDVPRAIVEIATRVLRCDLVAIMAFDHGRAVELSRVVSATWQTDVDPPDLLGASPQVLERTRPLRREGDAERPHVLALKIAAGDRPLGVLWLLRDGARPPFADRDLERADVLAGHAVLALDNRRLLVELRERLDALERARKRVVGSAQLEAMGRASAELSSQLDNPLSYLRTHLRDLHAWFEEAQHRAPVRDAELQRAAGSLSAAEEGLARLERVARDLSSVAQHRTRERFELGSVLHLAVRLARVQSLTEVQVANDGHVHGNAGQLSQALVALLQNAAEAVAGRPEARIRLRLLVQGGTAYVRIDDNGAGMPPAVLARVGQLFFSTRGREGLGVYTARSIVTEHGGSLRVRSEPGAGTAVLIALPAQAVVEDALLLGEADGIDAPDPPADADGVAPDEPTAPPRPRAAPATPEPRAGIQIRTVKRSEKSG